MNAPRHPKPRVLIGGGGFAGVKAARELAQRGFAVTLVSRESSFAYYPQLYHAATGGVRSESAIPLEEIFAGLPVEVIRDTLTWIDLEKHVVHGQSGAQYHYHDLILALGNVTNYFGIKGLDTFSYGIKSIDEALKFKEHLHRELVEEKRLDPHYIIIGAGPTGVELAGALRGYLDHVVRNHGLDPRKIKIELVEAAPRILPRLPEAVARRVNRRLERLGIKVLTSMKVVGETAEALEVEGQSIASRTVIWTSGVANSPFFHDNAASFQFDKPGRVVVDDHLQAAPHVYVLGDNAATKYTGLAQTAIADAKFVSANLARQANGAQPRRYRPHRPVSVVPVGAHWASVAYGWLRCYGSLGWLIRRVADLIAYSDIENWRPALQVWLTDGRGEEVCSICRSHQQLASS